MNRKRILIMAVLVFLTLPLCASFICEQSFVYDFFFPQQSHVLSLRTDFLWGQEEGLSKGLVFSLGWGFEHFSEFGSNALVYGPALSIGPAVQYAFQNGFELTGAVLARAAYSLYPQILRGELSVDAKYHLNGKIYMGLGVGVLFPQWNANTQALFGVRL